MKNQILDRGRLHEISTLDTGPQWRTIPPMAPAGLPVGKSVTSKRRSRPDRVVIHWGGSDPHHLHACLDGEVNGDGSNDHISTHFGISLIRVFQFADLDMKCWHAGWANDRSVGIDITQWCAQAHQAGKKRRCYACGRDDHCAYGVDYRDAQVVDNPSPIGPRRVLGLHPVTAKTVREFVRELCDFMGIRCDVAERDRHYSRAEYNDDDGPTVYGHHNISTSGKIDYAPWYDAIWG